MKKIVALIATALLALALVALAGCGSTANKKFVVGFVADFPPYSFIDSAGEFGEAGAYVGFDLELAQAVCEKVGWEFVAMPIDWNAKDQMLSSGAITCIWDGFTYEGREDAYLWSDRYMVNAQVLVAKADSGYSSLADLAGKVVLTEKGTSAYDLLVNVFATDNAKFAGGGVKVVDSFAAAFAMLEAGECDAVVCDLSYFAYQDLVKPHVFANVQTLAEEHYAAGFAKDNKDAKAMIAEINKALKQLDSDGVIKDLCRKYAAYGTDYQNWCLGKE